MTNISVKNHTNEGKNKGLTSLGMHLPYIDDFFDKFTHSWPFTRPSFGSLESTDFTLNPKVDIKEDKKSYKMSVELPGLDLENINLDLSDGVLTLSGEKKTEKEEDPAVSKDLQTRRNPYATAPALLRCRMDGVRKTTMA